MSATSSTSTMVRIEVVRKSELGNNVELVKQTFVATSDGSIISGEVVHPLKVGEPCYFEVHSNQKLLVRDIEEIEDKSDARANYRYSFPNNSTLEGS